MEWKEVDWKGNMQIKEPVRAYSDSYVRSQNDHSALMFPKYTPKEHTYNPRDVFGISCAIKCLT